MSNESNEVLFKLSDTLSELRQLVLSNSLNLPEEKKDVGKVEFVDSLISLPSW